MYCCRTFLIFFFFFFFATVRACLAREKYKRGRYKGMSVLLHGILEDRLANEDYTNSKKIVHRIPTLRQFSEKRREK